MKTSFTIAKPLIFLLFIMAVGWATFAISYDVWDTHHILKTGRDVPKPSNAIQIPIVDEGDVTPECPISGPKGPWERFQMRDLPHGSCSGTQVCSIWTKDSCPGTNYPGPAIKWKCVCDSGTWRCDEQERTQAACIER